MGFVFRETSNDMTLKHNRQGSIYTTFSTTSSDSDTINPAPNVPPDSFASYLTIGFATVLAFANLTAF